MKRKARRLVLSIWLLSSAGLARAVNCDTAGQCFDQMAQSMRLHRDGQLSDADYDGRMRALYFKMQEIAADPTRADAAQARTILAPGNVMSSHISDDIPDATAKIEDFKGLREELEKRRADRGPVPTDGTGARTTPQDSTVYLPGIDPPPKTDQDPSPEPKNPGTSVAKAVGMMISGAKTFTPADSGGKAAEETKRQADAVVKVMRDQPKAAARSLDAASAKDPQDADLAAADAAAHELAGDHAGAAAAARRALAADPGNQLARMILGHPDEFARANSKLGALKNPFDQKGAEPGFVDLRGGATPAQRAGAEKSLAWQAAGLPSASELKTKAQQLLASAVDKLAAGDVSGALFEVSRALLLDPANVRARVLRAHISNLARVHNYEAALKEAEEALKLDPKNAAALFEKGYAELQLGDTAGALRDIEAGLELDPNSGMGRFYHAMALEKAGLVAKAIDEYRRAAELDGALKPLVDEALARLISTEAPRGRLPRSVPLKPFLLMLLGVTAFALVFEGGKRVLYKDWKTTAPALPDKERPATATGTLAPGTMLDATFRIERELARGGIGIVYQATDVKLKRVVAVKHLQKEAYESGLVREKFLKEAQLAAKLSHPNLAQIYSVVGEGELYLVFEFVEGETLHERLARKIKLPLVEIKQMMREVGEAVDYAHSKNVIHRDLKPANVMMTADGHYKVLDFGIAHETRDMSAVTMTQAWGTPPYMAPEQEMGSVRKESDLYAIGVMLYELVVGQRPFEGAGMLDKKLRADFIPIKRANPDASAALQPFFVKALSPDPEKRFRSAKEMARALEAIEDTPVRAS